MATDIVDPVGARGLALQAGKGRTLSVHRLGAHQRAIGWGCALALVLLVAACDVGEVDPDTVAVEETGTALPLAAGPGVDVDERVVRVGALNDRSGPAASIGTPYAVGKRMLVEQVNDGGLALLPEGWRVELVERDHGYRPERAVEAFDELADEVLYVATSFGTATTLPLVEPAERERLVVFSASLASELDTAALAPSLAPSYGAEVHQAVDWALADAGGDGDGDHGHAASLGVVYQDDAYGEESLAALRRAAAFHDVSVVAEQAVAPGETDVAQVVAALEQADADHVLLATLASSSAPVLAEAGRGGYAPTWLALTPAWMDRLFEPTMLAPEAYADLHWVTGLRLWGEDVPGMPGFLDAYERYGADRHPPDVFMLASYAQGVVGLEALAAALEQGDVTRAGYLRALRSITAADGAGLLPSAVDLTDLPYPRPSDTRVLAPGANLQDWRVERDFSTPASYDASE